MGCSGRIGGPEPMATDSDVPDGGADIVGDAATSPDGQSTPLADGRLPPRVWLLKAAQIESVVADALGFPVSAPVAFLQGKYRQFSNQATQGIATESFLRWLTSFAETAAAQAPAHTDRLLSCDPQTEGEQTCAIRYIATLTQRLYRRPPSVAEQDALLALYNHPDNDTFEEKVELVVIGALLSPSFLYRFELGTTTPTGALTLTSLEIADLIAFSLTNAPPDTALRQAAESDTLHDPDVREHHIRRLFPAMRAQLARFGREWLGVAELAEADKDEAAFPQFTPELQAQMLEETSEFVSRTLLDSNKTFADLFNAGSSWMSPALAAHYGLEHGPGDGLAAVAYNPSQRLGVLTQASFMSAHATALHSSPIRRGVFVWRHLLCQALADPPPDVNASEVTATETQTARDALAQHTAQDSCRVCHQIIDPIGLALENYDAIGGFRPSDRAPTIDVTGSIYGQNVDFEGAVELAQWLSTSAMARACFIEKFTQYMMGASVGAPARTEWLNQVERTFADDSPFIELLVSVVRSPEFIERKEAQP